MGRRGGVAMSLLVEGVALTPSGRPVLAPEELELRMIERVDVEFGDKRAGNMRGGLQGREADKYVAGVALVTSHRLIWLDQARAPGTEGLSCSVHLSRVIEAAPVPLKMFGSRTRRLRLALRRGIVGPNDAGGALVLAFRGENPDAFTAAVADALAKKTWLAEPPPPPSTTTDAGRPTRPFATRVPPGQPPPPPTAPAGRPTRPFAISAGVGGVLHRQHQEHKQRQETLGGAFTDMNALMAKAKEMVTLAEHLASVANRRQSKTTDTGDASSPSDASDAETTEMDAMMLSMGIASPVTRETAGALYHQQLARQLADWLPQVLAKRGGILALPDVFCLFNRARGSELISPEDLLKACQLWRRLGVPLQYRRFESGVQVVQSLDRSDDEVCATLTEMINRPISREDDDERDTMRRMDAYSASVALGIPPTIASEYLLMAERHGILCRDDGPEATYFYPNFFPECEAT